MWKIKNKKNNGNYFFFLCGLVPNDPQPWGWGSLVYSTYVKLKASPGMARGGFIFGPHDNF